MANNLRSKTLTATLPGGCEIVLTLLQPQGVPDAVFEEYIRWAENALAEHKKIQAEVPRAASSVEAAPRGKKTGLWSAVRAALIPDSSEESASESGAAEAHAGDDASAPATGKKLYVGNLPYAWTDILLRELFAAQGTVVTAAIARFRGRDGRSRGFGFVEMSTEAEAQTAIEKLHEALAGDRKMVVRLARTRESNAPADGSAPTAAPRAASQPPRSRGGRGRSARSGRSGGRPSSRPARPETPSPAGSSDRPARQTGISNNSGYEIYPRDEKGGFASEPTARSSAPPRSSIEPSPYMDDVGDVENRGNRPPRRRNR